MLVLAIMMMLATAHITEATQILPLRPITLATGPAKEELTKAPSVMREEMSCCRSVEMFHPVKVDGSWYPKTWTVVNTQAWTVFLSLKKKKKQ